MPLHTSSPQQGKKLLDQVRDILRVKHYSYRTEQSYVDWIKRFILFHKKRHPLEMDAPEIQDFITYLAVEPTVSASTQNQALSAIIFLYRYGLEKDVQIPKHIIHASNQKHLPTVLSRQEALAVIDQMSGLTRLMAQILYGSGLRLMECMRLRVKDVDFDNHQILVRDGKGEKDRATILPASLIPEIQRHLRQVNIFHQQDLRPAFVAVYLPYPLDSKY